MVKRNENMSEITVNHSEKVQVGLKTKQNSAFSLFLEGIPETLGQRKVKNKGKRYTRQILNKRKLR